jgi:predicted DsbA family dithiol-disulfide isomerase
VNIDIWSDVVCPWCYIGKRRFEAALGRFDHREQVTVTWHSYQLDPTARSTPEGVEGNYVERLAAKFGGGVEQARQMLGSMTQTAAAEGLDYHFDIAKPANTFDAHRLLHLAAARGVQDELEEQLFRATFTLGQPVGDHHTLTDIAVVAGLDRDEVVAVLADDSYADDVRADEEQARAYGITGVPFFVIDSKYGVSGAQPAEALLEVMTQAWQQEHPLTVVAGSGEHCEGDVCAI